MAKPVAILPPLEEKIAADTQELCKWETLEGRRFCFVLVGWTSSDTLRDLVKKILRHKGVLAVSKSVGGHPSASGGSPGGPQMFGAHPS